jgi:hypothetical protein
LRMASTLVAVRVVTEQRENRSKPWMDGWIECVFVARITSFSKHAYELYIWIDRCKEHVDISIFPLLAEV